MLRDVMLCALAAIVSFSLPWSGNAAAPSMFTSKEKMEQMVETEKTLFQVLDNYTLHLEERAQKLKTFHEEFRQAFEEASNGVEDYLDNPVNAFLFTRRLLVTWHQVENIMSGDPGKDWARELSINRLLKGIALPSKDDLAFAARQVQKLQNQYQLNAAEMAAGGPYGIKLNSGDCFELGREAYEHEDFEHCEDWMQEALLRVDDGRAKKHDVVEYLAASAYLQGRVRKALHLTERLVEMAPKHSKAQNNIKYYSKRLEEIQEEKKNAQKKDLVADVTNWQEEDVDEWVEEICSQRVGLSARVQARLRCRLAHRENAFLALARLKEEELYLKPRIVMYHSVLSDADVVALQAAAEPLLTPHTADGVTHASMAVLPGNIVSSASTVTRRAAQLSGLDATYADALSLVRYDFNGSYRAHLDWQQASTPVVRKSGNKLATVQFFLDGDVADSVNSTNSAATVFPALKLAVRPEKGSTLLWFNLRADGRVDELTLHTTCRVTSDHHWEATSWLRTFGNEAKRPCGLTQAA